MATGSARTPTAINQRLAQPQFGRDLRTLDPGICGNVVRHDNSGSGQGSVSRVVEFAPGVAKFMHRTETLDYAICLKGECDLELDDGRTMPMKAGDICVQRGTMQALVAKGSEPAVFAFVLIDAEPVEKGGKKLTTHYD